MHICRDEARPYLLTAACLIALALNGCVAAKVAGTAVGVTTKAAGTAARATVGGVRAASRAVTGSGRNAEARSHAASAPHDR